ncbi:DUF4870 domain-containing protein [Maribacter sp. X9]|uniref:DUF4870 domain-containing protein n=1 Tax=Maribacter sp. X9 TaxID=3402159 RepID=UPI003AF3404C
MKNIHPNNADMKEGKNTAIIAYCTLIGLIIAFTLNSSKKNPFANFHIKQSVGLALTGLILYIIDKVPYIGGILNLLGLIILFYMWIMGLMNAINGVEKPVPLLGNAYKELFKNI